MVGKACKRNHYAKEHWDHRLGSWLAVSAGMAEGAEGFVRTEEVSRIVPPALAVDIRQLV